MAAYGIIVLLHFGALIFLPALIFISVVAVKRKQFGDFGASIFLTGALLLVLLQLSQFPLELVKNIIGNSGRHIVPFSLPLKKYQAYDLISAGHIIDIVNFLCLSYPAVIILLLLSIIIAWKQRQTIAVETWFMLLTAFCGIMFISILNCEIGMSRDWDIIAPISLGVPVATIALWNTIGSDRKLKDRILMMLCAVSLLYTGLWVGINKDEVKAEKRFEILTDNRLWSINARLDAYEELAVYYRERGDYEKAIQYYQKYNTLDSTNNRLWGNLAEAFQLAGNNKKAIEVYETMVHLGMDNYKIITNLGILLADEQRYIEAMTLFRRAEAEAPEEPIVKYCLGRTIMISEHAHKKALPYFLEAIHFNPVFSQAYNAAAECYLQLGDSIRAEQLISKLQNLSGNSNFK